jgi:fructokinase
VDGGKVVGKIVTLGEVVADVYREEMPSEVELPFTARPGGAPANVAVAAARLGAETAFVGRLGDDLFGEFILWALEAVGVDISAVLRQPPPTRTTLAFVEVAEDGDREFTFYRSVPAADELLAPEDVKRETLSGASFVNFGSIPLIKDPVRSATRKFAELARELDIPVAFDVNLREHLWESLETARKTIEPMLDISTVVKLSDDELSPVLGAKNAEEAAKTLLARGVSLVLISMGSKGAFYATRQFSGSMSTFEIERVVDATGAGDAFLGATLTHLSESPEWLSDEERVREAVRRGTAAGALACTDYGAMRALPTREELERFMAVRS